MLCYLTVKLTPFNINKAKATFISRCIFKIILQ
jgi:hypothetical protein